MSGVWPLWKGWRASIHRLKKGKKNDISLNKELYQTYMTGCYEGRRKPFSDLRVDKGPWREPASLHSEAANSVRRLSSSWTHIPWTNLFIQCSASPPVPQKPRRDSTALAPTTTGKSIPTWAMVGVLPALDRTPGTSHFWNNAWCRGARMLCGRMGGRKSTVYSLRKSQEHTSILS